MARRTRKTVKVTTTPPASTEVDDAPQDGGALGPSTSEQSAATVRRVMLTVMISVFLMFMGTVMVLFQSGGSIQWKKELALIDSRFARGEKKEAAQELEAFGKRWPDAPKTVPWNKKAGLYFGEAGDWASSAKYYRQAVEIDDQLVKSRQAAQINPGIRALAGEASFKAGDLESATEMLNREIKEVPRAVGDHDRAHYYLGLAEEQRGNLAKALEHFQAIAEPEPWKAEVDRFYRDLNEKLIEPARKDAAEKSIQEILTSKQAD
ncbi:tetratricopeptide repeat protein [bacterium]|nr:tetratricopeptide repeat protein [bacterium]